MIIQFLIAALAGGGAYLLLIRKKIALFISRKKQEKNEMSDNADEGIADNDERV